MDNNNEFINSQLDVKLQSFLPRLSIALQNKLLYSIQLLQKAEKLALSYDATGGYFLAFSGGKDSQCLYHVAKLAGVKFVAHMNLTSVDPPEVIRFVKQQYPDVHFIKPKKSIYQYAVEKQILPTQRVRWCCNEYKEHAGAGKVTLIGIRHAESSRRAKRNEVEISNQQFSGTLEGLDEYREKRNSKKRKSKNNKSVLIVTASGERTLGCLYGKETLLISPIIHWTFADVWEFLNKLGVAHCELYDQGYTRIGCICCPMSSVKQKQKELARYPHVKRNWIKAIKAIRNGAGLQKRIYLVEHPQGLDASPKRQSIALDAGGYINHPDPEHWIEIIGSPSCPRPYPKQQETEIAENIFDWWISGKSYKRWYSDKFLQLTFDFDFGD